MVRNLRQEKITPWSNCSIFKGNHFWTYLYISDLISMNEQLLKVCWLSLQGKTSSASACAHSSSNKHISISQQPLFHAVVVRVSTSSRSGHKGGLPSTLPDTEWLVKWRCCIAQYYSDSITCCISHILTYIEFCVGGIHYRGATGTREIIEVWNDYGVTNGNDHKLLLVRAAIGEYREWKLER